MQFQWHFSNTRAYGKPFYYSKLFSDITYSISWYHKIKFVLSLIHFVISRIRICDIVNSNSWHYKFDFVISRNGIRDIRKQLLIEKRLAIGACSGEIWQVKSFYCNIMLKYCKQTDRHQHKPQSCFCEQNSRLTAGCVY